MLSPSLVLSSRRLHPPRLLHRHARRQLRSGTLRFPSSFTSQLERQTFPQIQWDGYSTFGSTFGGNNGSIFTVSDTWSWSGCSARPAATTVQVRRRAARAGQQPAEPDLVDGSSHLQPFTQRNALAGSVDAGSSVASLLLGYPADGSTTTVRACRRSSRSSTTAGTTSACSCRTTGGSTAADAERRSPLGLRVTRRRGPEPAEHRLRHDVAEHVPGPRPR